jgi:hypothetical protein
MRHTVKWYLWLCMLTNFVVGSAPASPMQTLSVESMTADASLIVAGRITNLGSQWNHDHTQIITTVRIAVSEVLKGNFTESELSLRMLGGTIPEENISLDIVEAPSFAINDDVILLLKKNYASGLPFVGDVEGAFVVQSDGRMANVAGLTLSHGELRSRITAAAQMNAQQKLDPRVVQAIQAKAAGR